MMLDTQQQAAVTSTANETLILAGPGAGKTTVLVARVIHLIALGMDPEKIVILSFSNAGASEVRARLKKRDVHVGFIGTLHAYCLRILREHGHRIGYRKTGNITIAQQDIARELLLEQRKRMGMEKKLSEKALAEQRGPDAVRVVTEYRRALKRANMVDYDGILADALALLTMHPTAKPKIEALLVDEVQDSQIIDWAIYTTLPGQKTFIGDMDQSCYRFRGAEPQLFMARTEQPGTKVYLLERNYRSDVAICQAANFLISKNVKRLPKMINPESNALGQIETMQLDTSRDEMMFVIRSVREAQQRGIPFEEQAVIARTNDTVDQIRKTMIEMSIPVARAPQVQLPADWDFCLTTIQLMLDPANNLLAERYMKGIGMSLPVINRLKMDAMKTGTALHTLGRLPPWLAEVSTLGTQLAKAGVAPDSCGLVLERIAELPQPFPTVSDVLADLWQPQDWRKDNQPKTGVTCSTIHSVKGKEFDLVFVVGCEEGMMPSLTQTADLEEERRLFFIAITRARHELVLTHCASRFAWGKHREQKASRFLFEIQNLPHNIA